MKKKYVKPEIKLHMELSEKLVLLIDKFKELQKKFNEIGLTIKIDIESCQQSDSK